MNIVLLGAGGQLAHDLLAELTRRGHTVVGWTRAEADLTNAAELKDKLTSARPDAVVNAAAYNLVDQAEKEPETAFAANAFGPRALAAICAELDCRLMHFSTDYVFGLETRAAPWTETDAPGPVSVYGASKLAGEYFVRSGCPKHFVARTCGLYGVKGSRGKGGNFVETMLRLGQSGKPVRVVNDQICTPSFTADVAATAAALLDTDRFGLYHVANAGQTTWYEFAREVFRQASLSVDCQPIASAEFGAPAKRPPFSALALDKLVGAGVPTLRPWQMALADYLRRRPQAKPSP
jgi:dTDP-4-dehydrorhamnose reductase